jgi:hypothetical protein|tara:strand:+ start:1615 stop:1785 length:171 start_codon:yes stop_codon:yes gene_type:complete
MTSNFYDEHEAPYRVILNYKSIATAFAMPFYYSETPVKELQSKVTEWVKLGWMVSE